jgi:hypothetical protein
MKQRPEVLKGPIPLDFEMSSYVVWRCLFLKTLQSSCWETEVLIIIYIPESSFFCFRNHPHLVGIESHVIMSASFWQLTDPSFNKIKSSYV